MINAKEAKSKTLSNGLNYFNNSIYAKILGGISDNRFHCIWYTPLMYDCTEKDIKAIEDIKNELTNLGYSCRIIIFKPNKYFNNTRVKLYINWE